MKYEIEKDIYINDGKWIVWEIYPNYKIDRVHKRTKRECKEWLKTMQ